MPIGKALINGVSSIADLMRLRDFDFRDEFLRLESPAPAAALSKYRSSPGLGTIDDTYLLQYLGDRRQGTGSEEAGNDASQELGSVAANSHAD